MSSVFKIHHIDNYTVVSNEIIKSKDLSLKAIGLAIKILSLPDDWEYSEEGLAEICKDGITSVRTAIHELEETGYLVRNRIRENGVVVGIEYNFYESLNLKNLDLENISLESTDNKINNKLNKDINKVKKDIYTPANTNSELISQVINYLNLKTNKHYKDNNKNTCRLINARLKDGYTIDDFKKVIDVKCDDWLKTDFEQYLRPETLFGNKFDNYLNQPVKVKYGVDDPKNWSINQNKTEPTDWRL